MIGIYGIKNKVNGKIYVGQSSNVKARLYNHKSALKHDMHMNDHLQKAWNKYGEFNFNFFIIEELDSIDKLNEKEIFWIDKYNANNREYGYNRCEGGGGSRGYKHTEEALLKIKEASTGSNHPFYGKKHSFESIEQMRKSKIGKKMDEETKRKIGESEKGEKHHYYGKNRDEEVKRKISNKLKGRKLPEDTKNKMSESKKGIRFSEEWKTNLSKSKLKLSDLEVIDILERLLNKEPVNIIAGLYNVSPPTIRSIKNNKSYIHIDRSRY